MNKQEKIKEAKEVCSAYFKDNNGDPFELTDTQAEIFYDIFYLQHSRMALLAMTRYGKSEIVAMAILLRSMVKREFFTIGANTKDLGMIMMDKCITHLGDNPKFEENLVLQFKSLTSKLKKKESKSEFTWVNGGGIRMITLGATMKKSEVESAIGQGATRLILEECSAIPNNIVGMAMRMLGDDAEDNFCLKLGNALYRNHFYKSVNSGRYKTYSLDYDLAIKEGRTTQDFVDERKEDMTPRQFEAMYLCKFPDPEEVDHLGYYSLFKEGDFKKGEAKHRGDKYLGFDPSEGRDENVGVLRSDTYAEVVHNSFVSDLMAQTKIMTDLIDRHSIDAHRCFPDDTGVGAGITDRAKEMGYAVKGIKWGMASEDKRYANLKAQNYFDLRKWVADGGIIDDEAMIEELMTIRWKETTSKKIQIKTKKEYAAEGIKSQNCFVGSTMIKTPSGERRIDAISQGDKIITPSGYATVLKTHKNKAHVADVTFGGNRLTGTGNHKIVTSKSCTRIDSLSKNMLLLPYNKLSKFIWKGITKLYTVEELFGGLKQTLNILLVTSAKTEKEKGGYCIDTFGKQRVAKKYLMDTMSIILMAISLIILLKILRLLRVASTVACTLKKTLKIRSLERKYSMDSKKLLSKLRIGMGQKMDSHGTKSMAGSAGRRRKENREALLLNVGTAVTILSHILRVRSFALANVCKQTLVRRVATKLGKVFVDIAEKNMYQINMEYQSFAVEDVRKVRGGEKNVYNLTLDKDNVYYANGVLVFNCADALAFCFNEPDLMDGDVGVTWV